MLGSASAVTCSLHLVIVHSLAAHMNDRQKRARTFPYKYQERNRLTVTLMIASALVIGIGLWEFYDHFGSPTRAQNGVIFSESILDTYDSRSSFHRDKGSL